MKKSKVIYITICKFIDSILFDTSHVFEKNSHNRKMFEIITETKDDFSIWNIKNGVTITLDY